MNVAPDIQALEFDADNGLGERARTGLIVEQSDQMEADLPLTAELLPETFDFDVIGCCCTSGATMIGEARLDEILRGVHPRAKISNPVTACKAALQALKRTALITPCAPDISLSQFHDPDSKRMLDRKGHLRVSEAGNSTFPQAPVTGVQKQAEGLVM